MNRREFSSQALGVAGLTLAPAMWTSAQAQAAAPIEGTNYIKLSQNAPVSTPAGKVEVVEFFWYGCPHCFHFEPFLAAWVAKLPPDVVFKRVPVVFREVPFVAHQQLYYAIEALGLIPQLHAKVFHAIHVEQQKLDTPEAISAFAAKNGVDATKFMGVYNSFAVQSKTRQARSLMEAYKLDGVPTLGIAGQFTTSVSLNATPEKTLAVADFLIGKARKGK
jgi:thiol:disulfide interchange protein DsbA